MILSNFLGKAACLWHGKHKRGKRVQLLNGVEFLRCPRCGFLRTVKAKRVAG